MSDFLLTVFCIKTKYVIYEENNLVQPKKHERTLPKFHRASKWIIFLKKK